MAEQIKDKVFLDVDEIWGSEVNLYMSKCMQAQRSCRTIQRQCPV